MDFDYERMRSQVEDLGRVFASVQADLQRFGAFLRGAAGLESAESPA